MEEKGKFALQSSIYHIKTSNTLKINKEIKKIKTWHENTPTKF